MLTRANLFEWSGSSSKYVVYVVDLLLVVCFVPSNCQIWITGLTLHTHSHWMASEGDHHHHHHHHQDHDHHHHDHDHHHHHDGEGETNSWVGKDGKVYHSHDGLAPHSHEPIYSPGYFTRRAPPLLNRNFNERAFTVGIGGPVGTGWVPHPSSLLPSPLHETKLPLFFFFFFFIFIAMQQNSSHVGPLWTLARKLQSRSCEFFFFQCSIHIVYTFLPLFPSIPINILNRLRKCMVGWMAKKERKVAESILLLTKTNH